MVKGRLRRFKKFVMLDRRGNPLWGTMATDAEDTQKRYDRFNPDPTGEGMGEQLARIEMKLYLTK